MATMSGAYPAESQTGLLTRCVPHGLKSSSLYSWWLRFVRLLQPLSALISLGIFSSRIVKIFRLAKSFKAEQSINGASKAVEGILAAAVLYTIIATIMMCLTRRSSGGPTWMRWLWVLLDLAFVGAFIAVADLTRPSGGPAGPRHCYTNSQGQLSGSSGSANQKDQSCNLPWGTFILSIVSILLHLITASFHEVKDRRNARHVKSNRDYPPYENGNANGHQQMYENGTGPGIGHHQQHQNATGPGIGHHQQGPGIGNHQQAPGIGHHQQYENGNGIGRHQQYENASGRV